MSEPTKFNNLRTRKPQIFKHSNIEASYYYFKPGKTGRRKYPAFIGKVPWNNYRGLARGSCQLIGFLDSNQQLEYLALKTLYLVDLLST